MYGKRKGGPCLFIGVLVGPTNFVFFFRAPTESEAFLHDPHPFSVEQRGELTSATPKPRFYRCGTHPEPE